MPCFTFVQENFPFPELLQLFFDGKQREDVTTGIKREGISVAVGGPGMEKEKFLGNKSVAEKGTGLACGGVVVDILIDWKLRRQTKALNYDTCPINTGSDNGKYKDRIMVGWYGLGYDNGNGTECTYTRIQPVFGLVKSSFAIRCLRIHRTGNGKTTDVVPMYSPHL